MWVWVDVCALVCARVCVWVSGVRVFAEMGTIACVRVYACVCVRGCMCVCVNMFARASALCAVTYHKRDCRGGRWIFFRVLISPIYPLKSVPTLSF